MDLGQLGTNPEVVAALEAEERELNAPESPSQPAATQPASTPPGDRAPTPEPTESGPTSPKPESTPVAPADNTPQQQQTQPRDEKGQFRKDQERRVRTWQEINAAKDQHTAAVKAHQVEAKRVQAERDAWQQEQRAAQQANRKPPEFYEQSQVALERDALQLERQAKQLEDQGEFDKAKLIERQAIEKQVLAKQCKEWSDYLRKNPLPPDPTAEQRQAQRQAQEKEWIGKASQDFPEVAKPGTEKAKALVALCQELGIASWDQAGKITINDPVAMYYAARMAEAEENAKKVSPLEKEVSELRAKLKERNEQLGLGGPGAVPHSAAPDDSSLTDDQLEDKLRSEAARMGPR